MADQLELNKSNGSQSRFVLKAGNGEIILISEPYTSEASAGKGIVLIRSDGLQEGHYKRKTASGGKPYFDLKIVNHQTISSSQMCVTMQSREIGTTSVKINGTSQMVKDNT